MTISGAITGASSSSNCTTAVTLTWTDNGAQSMQPTWSSPNCTYSLKVPSGWTGSVILLDLAVIRLAPITGPTAALSQIRRGRTTRCSRPLRSQVTSVDPAFGPSLPECGLDIFDGSTKVVHPSFLATTTHLPFPTIGEQLTPTYSATPFRRRTGRTRTSPATSPARTTLPAPQLLPSMSPSAIPWWAPTIFKAMRRPPMPTRL